MSPSIVSNYSILDLPDEMITAIILYLNARERVAFGNASERFHFLIFRNKQMLRTLDFSRQGHLTSLSDIEPYFRDKEIRKHVHKVNLTNVTCISTYHTMKNIFSWGIYLVDINIQGIEISIHAMLAFLEGFPYLRRLSIDWPRTAEWHAEICQSALREPFGQLRYLSVRMRWTQYSLEFIGSLHLCKNLEELHITQISIPFLSDYEEIWITENRKLKNLKIVEYCGHGASVVMHHLRLMLTDPERWTSFILTPDVAVKGFYFEKNVEVCETLGMFQFSNDLLSNHLLTQVIIKTCEYGKRDFCCLGKDDELPCLMKIEEMKMLLKNPRYEVRYLKITHGIESYCSVHLLASIFPTLTELVLTNIIKGKEWSSLSPNPKKRLRRIGDPNSQDLSNNKKDSSFKMLTENTPHLRHFTLIANTEGLYDDEEWDLQALHLIAGWKSLKSLCLKNIPITDGEFLIEIAKQCVNLEELELAHLGSMNSCVYDNELPEMLSHCKNLRDVKIDQSNLFEVTKLLPSLENSLKLRRVSMRSIGKNDATKTLVSSIKNLLIQCPELNMLLCTVGWRAKVDIAKLTLSLRRFRVELNRPALQFQVVDDHYAEDKIHEDYSPPSFPCNLDRFGEISYEP